ASVSYSRRPEAESIPPKLSDPRSPDPPRPAARRRPRRNMAVESMVPGGTYALTIRAEYANKPGMLGRVASVIGEAGGNISSIDLVEADRSTMVRDITVAAEDAEHGRQIIDEIRKIKGLVVRS